MYNPILIAGPQMNKKIMRKLIAMMPLSDEQRDYVRHAGGYDAQSRLQEMDLMGIDQVLVIPTMVIMNVPFAEDLEGVDVLFRAFEETGVLLGMHTFPAGVLGRTAFPGALTSPGELVNHAGADSQTLSFIFEMQSWLAQVLLGGFLDRYPNLKMAVFESN